MNEIENNNIVIRMWRQYASQLTDKSKTACKKCGWKSISVCVCAFRRFEEELTNEEIKQFLEREKKENIGSVQNTKS